MTDPLHAHETEIKRRVEQAIGQGAHAFWSVVARFFPEITTGDLDPGAVFALDRSLTRVVELWIEENQPNEGPWTAPAPDDGSCGHCGALDRTACDCVTAADGNEPSIACRHPGKCEHDIPSGGHAAAESCPSERFVGELRTLLRDWAEHNDTAIVTLTQDMLRHYGLWNDVDADAADNRRATFNAGVDKQDRAYDGWSCEPQKRNLTARERDILCRILRDTVRNYRATGPTTGLAALIDGESRVIVSPSEFDLLQAMQFVLTPRHD